MQGFLFVLTFLLSNFGYANNFGDQVIACMVEKKLISTSDNFAICEKLVQDQRDKETANKAVNEDAAKLRQTMAGVADAEPDVEARLRKLAADYNLPVDAVRLDRQTVDRRKMSENPYLDLIHEEDTAKLQQTMASVEDAELDMESIVYSWISSVTSYGLVYLMVCAVMSFKPRLLIFFQVLFVSIVILSVAIYFGYIYLTEKSILIVIVLSYVFIKRAKNTYSNCSYKTISEEKTSFWKSKSYTFRKNVFISLAWFLFCLVFFLVFDPLEAYEWGDEEYLKFFIISMLPVFLFLIQYLYRRFVIYDG